MAYVGTVKGGTKLSSLSKWEDGDADPARGNGGQPSEKVKFVLKSRYESTPSYIGAGGSGGSSGPDAGLSQPQSWE